MLFCSYRLNKCESSRLVGVHALTSAEGNSALHFLPAHISVSLSMSPSGGWGKKFINIKPQALKLRQEARM